MEGKANDALVRFLSKELGLPRSAVTITRGLKDRAKSVRLEGMSADAALRMLIQSRDGRPAP